MAKVLLETVEIGYQHCDKVVEKLMKRLDLDEQGNLVKFAIRQEASKSIGENIWLSLNNKDKGS